MVGQGVVRFPDDSLAVHPSRGKSHEKLGAQAWTFY